MGRFYSNKNLVKLPKMIIVEGFWNLGKTTLVKYLSKKLNYEIIPEPCHLIKNIKTVSQNGIEKNI